MAVVNIFADSVGNDVWDGVFEDVWFVPVIVTSGLLFYQIDTGLIVWRL